MMQYLVENVLSVLGKILSVLGLKMLILSQISAKKRRYEGFQAEKMKINKISGLDPNRFLQPIRYSQSIFSQKFVECRIVQSENFIQL